MSHIEWWDEPETNSMFYRHIGCDTPHHRWVTPLDDVPLPGEQGEETAECAHCCYVVPLRKRFES